MPVRKIQAPVDRITEVSAQLVLMVPRKAIYEFLRKDDHTRRMAELTSRISVLATHPSSQMVHESDIGRTSADIGIVTDKLKKMVRGNPWLAKEITEIIKTMSSADVRSKTNTPPIDAVTLLRLCKAHVVEDVPPSRVAFETTIGESIMRYEVELYGQDEGTKLMLSVKEKPPSNSRNAELIMVAAIQELSAFDIGYQAREEE